MKTFRIETVITEYSGPEEMPEMERTLLEKAREVSKAAYAPYSEFQVGAALLLENGVIVTGNNQENVAYPSGLCAERVAIYAAGANYPDVPVKAIAVSCRSERFPVHAPLSPCGACRQAMSEYEQRWDKPIQVILGGEKGHVHVIGSIKELLPLVFEAKELKRKKG